MVFGINFNTHFKIQDELYTDLLQVFCIVLLKHVHYTDLLRKKKEF